MKRQTRSSLGVNRGTGIQGEAGKKAGAGRFYLVCRGRGPGRHRSGGLKEAASAQRTQLGKLHGCNGREGEERRRLFHSLWSPEEGGGWRVEAPGSSGRRGRAGGARRIGRGRGGHMRKSLLAPGFEERLCGGLWTSTVQ